MKEDCQVSHPLSLFIFWHILECDASSMADSENVKHVVSSLTHNTHAPLYRVSVDAHSCVTEEQLSETSAKPFHLRPSLGQTVHTGRASLTAVLVVLYITCSGLYPFNFTHGRHVAQKSWNTSPFVITLLHPSLPIRCRHSLLSLSHALCFWAQPIWDFWTLYSPNLRFTLVGWTFVPVMQVKASAWDAHICMHGNHICILLVWLDMTEGRQHHC